MLEPHQKLTIFADGSMGDLDAKMAEGVLRYIENPICCVVDSRSAGSRVRDVCAVPSDVPIVASIEEAIHLGAEVLVLGTAPSGGRIPPKWMDTLDKAVASGLSIVNGSHDRLGEHYPQTKGQDQWIWDIRDTLGAAPPIATGLAGTLDNKRLLVVGTDMAIGKMTVGLEIDRYLRKNNCSSIFLATGQIGVTISGHGIALDAFKVDHACGAVERMVMAAADHDVIVIEGQGSLLHPGSTATLPLMRGSCANKLIMCHKAGMDRIQEHRTAVKVPPMSQFIALNEDLASVCGSLTKAQTIGIALNTRELSEADALAAIAELEAETGLPVQDVVRFGAEKLARALM